MPVGKCWYGLVEVLSDEDQNRDQRIVKVDQIKKFNIENFLNNYQEQKFFKFKVKIEQIVDGEVEKEKKYCCVLRVEDSYGKLERLKQKRIKGPALHLLRKLTEKKIEDTTDSENAVRKPEIPTTKETSQKKKERAKQQKDRRNTVQNEVMKAIRERQAAKNPTIEVSLEEWTAKATLISSLQQKVTNLKDELRKANEHLQSKDAWIDQLQKTASTITDIPIRWRKPGLRTPVYTNQAQMTYVPEERWT